MKEEIRIKVSRILSHDSNVSEKLSQSTMTHVEHSQLILEVLEEDIPTLIERIEQLEEILEFYSIRKNYKVQQSIEYGISPSKINVDEGCRARRILGKEEYP